MARKSKREVLSPKSSIHPPSIGAFEALLVDPDRKNEFRRIVRQYGDAAQRHHLLRILRDAKYSHQLRVARGKKVSAARAWFKKRDRWRAGVRQLDTDFEGLLVQFRDSIYPILRASNALPRGYSQDIADVFTAIERLQEAVTRSRFLSLSVTTRGHQREPYLADAIKAMRTLGITKADGQDMLVLVGVKRDASAL